MNIPFNWQMRSFVFTCYPLEGESIQECVFRYRGILESLGCTYYVIGLEKCPTTRRDHGQGFAQLSRKKWFNTIAKAMNCHIERQRGTVKEAVDYCKKDGSFVEGGEVRQYDSLEQQKRERWIRAMQAAKSGNLESLEQDMPSMLICHVSQLKQIQSLFLKQEDVSSRRCIWLWSRSTGNGKTRAVRESFPHAYWHPKDTSTWDGYRCNEHREVIFDDVDGSHTWLGSALKRFADIYPAQCNVKYGYQPLNYQVLIVTSNFHINEIWNGRLYDALKRRFTVLEALNWDEELGLMVNYNSIRSSWNSILMHNNII